MDIKIIAEAGVNHNGDIKIAKQLINAAEESKADYIKFQTFKAKKIVSKTASQADYQIKNIGKNQGQYEMLRKLELNASEHKELIEYCSNKKIEFLSTPFDLDSVDLLYELGMRVFKIPSGELTNAFILDKIGSLKNIEIIMSTGMANMNEIKKALNRLIKAGATREKITIMHCNTQYPTPINDVNLNAMKTIKKRFSVNVGYSDHTMGIEVSIAASAIGASIIEKHFTLDRNMQGPDHKASLEPNELKDMVCAIRNIEKALGSKEKTPTPSEKSNKILTRKSIYLSVPIKKSEKLTKKHLTAKRPGDGISPMEIDKIISCVANKDLDIDHKLDWSDIKSIK